ncbi:MAG: TVP38/TMEM64 family protein [Candidatus Electrothrix sp. AW1]|nr:TVP38/TMEM64 family protein [Candidatus Electrothrix sp. AX1]MCI5181008.1 TVP38/TMEM64 family protein [Candidatus Electrothrix gigas]
MIHESNNLTVKKQPANKHILGKVLLLCVAVLCTVLFLIFDRQELLSLTSLNASRQILQDFYAEHQLVTIAGYMLIYIFITALSLPGAMIMTLTGGVLFGFWLGLVLVSFASSIGATLAFLGARFLFRDSIQNRFGKKLAAINQGVAQDGALYLFSLRLVPIFPFFLINLVMGLTPIRTRVFYIISQIGMLPGTVIYINAGTQLGKITSAGDILSSDLLLSFALLGLFPLLAKKIVVVLKKSRFKQKV